MTLKIIHDQSPRKNVADPAGMNPQPPDHQSDVHPSHKASCEGLQMSTQNICFHGEIRKISGPSCSKHH